MINEEIIEGQHAVTLELTAFEPDWVGKFDQIEVWRSRSTSGGPYEELTAEDWKTARLPVGSEDPPDTPIFGVLVDIVGKQLDLLFRERDEISLIFTGADPLPYSVVADQITAGGRRLIKAYIAPNGSIVLDTYAVGTTSVIRVLGGDAAPILGFSTELPDSQAFGRDPRIPLEHNKETYQFVDGYGADSYWYKMRFKNHLQGTASEFTAPFQVGAGTILATTNIVVGYIDLSDASGSAIANREVIVGGGPAPELVSGVLTLGNRQSKFTDTNGHVEFPLIRGRQVTVVVVGTNIVKEVVPPTDQAIKNFNLIDPTYGTQNDYFKVRVADIPFAARRSL